VMLYRASHGVLGNVFPFSLGKINPLCMNKAGLRE